MAREFIAKNRPGHILFVAEVVEMHVDGVHEVDKAMLILYAPSPKSEIGDGVEGLRIDFAILEKSSRVECARIRVDFLVS